MNLLEKVIRGIRTFHDKGDPSKPRIVLNETRAEIADVSFTWDEIDIVEAYKIDLGTTDEVRILVRFGSPERSVTLSEEQEGFAAFMQAAESELSFPEGWWERLVRPAFQSCDATLFRRERQ